MAVMYNIFCNLLTELLKFHKQKEESWGEFLDLQLSMFMVMKMLKHKCDRHLILITQVFGGL